MNSFIYDYYNITCFNIDNNGEFYSFQYNSNFFYIYEIEDMNSVLFKFKYCNKLNFFNYFIFNKYNSIFSSYNDKVYVLIKKSNIKFNFNFLINNSLFLDSYCLLNWKHVWSKKIDYIYAFHNDNIELFDVHLIDCFDYFICMAEIALNLLNRVGLIDSLVSISFLNYLSNDFCNPLNTKLDIIERNFAEYLRIIFYSDNYNKISISNLIRKYSRMYNYNLVIIRLIYPHAFFELLDCYFSTNEKSYLFELKRMISMTDKYELYLHNLCLEMKKYQLITIDI